MKDRKWAYWYAVGYYEGRAIGDMLSVALQAYMDKKPPMPDEDELRAAMKEGYDAGVADYCAYDEGTQTQLENEELEAKKAVTRFVVNTKIEEV